MDKLLEKWGKINIKEFLAISSTLALIIFILSITLVGYVFEGVVTYILVFLFLLAAGSFIIYKMDQYEKKNKPPPDSSP